MRRTIHALALALPITLGLAAPASAQISSHCPHVRLLGPADASEVQWSLRGHIVAAGPDQRRVVRDALELMPPFLCLAVRRIVFIEDQDNPLVTGKTKPNDRQDLLYLNVASGMFMESALKLSAEARPAAIQTIIHECTHIAVRLLYTRTEASPPAWLEFRPDASLWPPEALKAADEVIERLRLEKGFVQEWASIHESFHRVGLAGGYYGEKDWRSHAGDNHVANGFTSAYGGKNLAEDIAEFTGWMIAAPLAAAPEDYACQRMRAQASQGVPSGLAAVYTKASFLLSAGFVPQRDFDRCVGNVGIEAPGEGLFIYNLASGTPQLKRTFDKDLKAEIGTSPEAPAVRLPARGLGPRGPGRQGAPGVDQGSAPT